MFTPIHFPVDGSMTVPRPHSVRAHPPSGPLEIPLIISPDVSKHGSGSHFPNLPLENPALHSPLAAVPENRLDRDFLLGADLVDLVAGFLAGDFSHINSFNNQSTSPDSILDWLLFYRETPD